MPRIQPKQNPDAKAQALLDAGKAKLGMVPNMFSTMAHAPVVLESYMNFSSSLAKGKLPATLREQIAIAVGSANRCGYCVSAHTTIGKMQKINEAELSQNMIAKSSDPKVQAALTFARQIVDSQGHVKDTDIAAIRSAGFSEEEIVEIIGNVAINLFTNYFNHIADTTIDFPKVSLPSF